MASEQPLSSYKPEVNLRQRLKNLLSKIPADRKRCSGSLHWHLLGPSPLYGLVLCSDQANAEGGRDPLRQLGCPHRALLGLPCRLFAGSSLGFVEYPVGSRSAAQEVITTTSAGTEDEGTLLEWVPGLATSNSMLPYLTVQHFIP